MDGGIDGWMGGWMHSIDGRTDTFVSMDLYVY